MAQVGGERTLNPALAVVFWILVLAGLWFWLFGYPDMKHDERMRRASRMTSTQAEAADGRECWSVGPSDWDEEYCAALYDRTSDEYRLNLACSDPDAIMYEECNSDLREPGY